MKKNKPVILGINSFFGGPHHDNGAFLFHGEEYIGINSERLDKVKQSNGYKYKVSSKGNFVHYDYDRSESCIEYCFEAMGISYEDVDVVVYLEGLPEYVKTLFPNAKVYGIYDHHLVHVFSAYFSSGFSDSAVLVIDGQGKRIENAQDRMIVQSAYYCEGNTIKNLFETAWDGDRRIGIGTMYEMVTRLLDFSSEGTTMGLSSYSSEKNILGKRLLENYDGHTYANDDVIKDISGSRLKFLNKEIFLNRLGMSEADLESEKVPYGFSSDIAAQLQYETQEIICEMARKLHEKTGSKNLCIVGGVGLNSVANGKVLERVGFENIYILPSTDDSGLAFGCALYGKFLQQGKNYTPKNDYNFYFGREYSGEKIREALEKYEDKISTYELLDSPEKTGAELLSRGNIIGWFQGGSESGPRALGNRSILADPRSIEIRDKVNRVKNREWWRPLAPSVLTEYMREYFRFPEGKNSESYKYMLVVVEALEKAKKEIPGVVHIDNTARIQEVCREDNALYHRLISEFHKITGTPVILNTSFNTKGEPIVETPEDAIKMFLSSELDYLIIGNYLLSKDAIYPELSFKRGLVLYNRLYEKWKKEIDDYTRFLVSTQIQYKKEGFHYEF